MTHAELLQKLWPQECARFTLYINGALPLDEYLNAVDCDGDVLRNLARHGVEAYLEALRYFPQDELTKEERKLAHELRRRLKADLARLI